MTVIAWDGKTLAADHIWLHKEQTDNEDQEIWECALWSNGRNKICRCFV